MHMKTHRYSGFENMFIDREKADIQEIVKEEKLFRVLDGSSILVTGATGLIGSMIVKSLILLIYCIWIKQKIIFY